METVSKIELGTFVMCVIAVFGLALTIKQLLQRNPPLHREFVDRETYERDQAAIHEEFRRQAVSRRAVYDRIEDQGKQLAEVKAEVSTHTRQLHNLDGKIDDLPERILNLVDRKAAS